MAEGHEILSASISNLEPSMCQAEIAVNIKYDKSIIKKNLKLAWAGDFESMKCLVAEFLEPEGVWKSVGSDKKLFSVAIPNAYHGGKTKSLFKRSNSMDLKQKLLSVFLPISVELHLRTSHTRRAISTIVIATAMRCRPTSRASN